MRRYALGNSLTHPPVGAEGRPLRQAQGKPFAEFTMAHMSHKSHENKAVTPAKAGVQVFAGPVDSRLRGNDDLAAGMTLWGHRRGSFYRHHP